MVYFKCQWPNLYMYIHYILHFIYIVQHLFQLTVAVEQVDIFNYITQYIIYSVLYNVLMFR